MDKSHELMTFTVRSLDSNTYNVATVYIYDINLDVQLVN